jgi:hypothetical protein
VLLLTYGCIAHRSENAGRLAESASLPTACHTAGTSGSPTTPRDGGFSRKCSSSGRSLYPRIDPAIITLVTGGSEWCLLGRKHEWPKGRWVRGASGSMLCLVPRCVMQLLTAGDLETWQRVVPAGAQARVA